MAPRPEPLSPDDAAILALESPAIAGHTLKLLLLEPGTIPVDLQRLRASVAARLESEPRGRQRIERAAQTGAQWVDDEQFDITSHVRRRTATEGIDEHELWQAAGELMSERLDPERPLWGLDLVGPLSDGREAIVARLHHAMVDGISSVRFLEAVLWDSDPAAAPRPAPARPGPRAAKPSRIAEARRLPGAVRRELAFTDLPLAQCEQIGASLPGHVTINDVLLAAIAGGLRQWLGSDAKAVPKLRAQIPVSLHHRDEGEGELGNRDSFLNVDLPLSEADPLVRLESINAETAKRKRLGDADELYDLFHALGRCKPVGEAVRRLAGTSREFSLSVSNVPGPRTPVTVAGRRVQRLCSVAEPADRHALRISAISCAGTIGIGLCTDPEAVSGLAGLASAIDEGFAELLVATGRAE